LLASKNIVKFALIENNDIMNSISLYTKYSSLPENLKNEISDYLEYLIQKHRPKESKKHPQPGCMKGTFIMPDNFDVPLEDFSDYM
jgi:hypothetical protein